MIAKNRVYIISSNVDDSIKKATTHVDIQLFKTFKSFEEYYEINPVDASMIIVNSKDLIFTDTSMRRLSALLASPFVSIQDSIYYLVDSMDLKEKVTLICERNDYDKIVAIYSPKLGPRDIADILNGDLLVEKETVTLVSTYRMRASEYEQREKEKLQDKFSEPYITDEDELSDVVLEEIPDDLVYTESLKPKRFIISSNDTKESTIWALMKAQYLVQSGRCLLVEKDIEYHTMLDYVSKMGIDYDFFDYKEMTRDVSDVINRIKNSTSRLIVIGTKHKLKYNYEIILSILVSTLSTDINYYIHQTNLNTIPYGEPVDIVFGNTAPDIFRCVNSIAHISDFNDLHFVGLEINEIGQASLTTSETKSLLTEIFRTNNLKVSVAKLRGLNIRNEVGISNLLMLNTEMVSNAS